jgi:aldehyde:ferredoxin oxidoreductase
MDKQKLWRVFERIRTLVRAINVRRGLRRKDERPPEDHWAVRDDEMEQKLLSKYYMFKGFNREGIPTEERLEELGLDFVAKDLIERGILQEKDNFTRLELAEAPENNILRG